MKFDTIFTNLGQGVVFALITFGFIIAAKKIADLRTKEIDDDYEIQENNNYAVGFRRTGLYLGYAIAFAGMLGGGSAGFATDIAAIFIDGVIITICLFSCRALNDRVMLPGIDNDTEALKGNTAVGLSECGMYIATGFVLNGAFSGTSESIATGALSAVVFFIVGQASLLLCGLCYEIITPFNIRDEIGKGNAAAGTALAGMLVALGIILRASIAGSSAGWLADFISFALYTLFGILLLLFFRKAIDWFLLPDTSIAVEVERDRNVAALALTEAGVISVAIVIGSVM